MKDLGKYYRETDTTDGCESQAAQECGITPDCDMDMHWHLTPNGTVREPAKPPLPQRDELRIARERQCKVGPDGEDDTVHLDATAQMHRILRTRPSLRLVPPASHTDALAQEKDASGKLPPR